MPEYPCHLASFDYVGCHGYFLTFCTAARQKYFLEADRVDLTLSQILRGFGAGGFELTAYCFMPDHLHVLATGLRDDADLRRSVASAKQYSGFHFRQRFRAPLWQRYGYERVLRDSENVQDVVRYIINNPLRAGLVDDIREYSFWGSQAYSREELLVHATRAG